MFRQSLAFFAAASLAVAPAAAQSSASALSIAPAVERAGPGEADSDLAGAGLPLIAFIAIVVGGVLLATGVIYDDDGPDSP